MRVSTMPAGNTAERSNIPVSPEKGLKAVSVFAERSFSDLEPEELRLFKDFQPAQNQIHSSINDFAFYHPDELEKGANNFALHWANSEHGTFYRLREAYVRFAILCPDLNEEILAYFSENGHWHPADGADSIDGAILERLFEAHQVMAALVSKNDLGALRGGEIDTRLIYR